VDIRREFISRWADRPITEITRRDVLAVIDASVDRGNPYQAHICLATSVAFSIGRLPAALWARQLAMRPYEAEGNYR
jgi:hypothetical protein